jgi:hypothetical protein
MNTKGEASTMLPHFPSRRRFPMMYNTDEIDPPGYDEQDAPNVVHVHIYDLPPEAEPPIVQSDPPTPDQPGQESSSPHEEPAQRTQRRSTTMMWAVIGFLLVGAVLTLVSLRPILFPAPEATITIVTVSTPIRAATTVTVVTGQAPKAGQITGRQLAAITMSQQRTIATTGTVHQDAQAAHGLITFYNAATYSQVIPAGTILAGTDGTQIVTEQDATLPAVSYPTLGAMTVAAHALIAGPAGDIAAGDIYGPCCRLNVSAVNSAFSGGQNARSYQTVTQQDISTGAAGLTKSLGQSVQAALQTQVSSDETLITPLPCHQSTTPNHQPGSEATQVTITVSETCTGTTYNTQQYQDQLAQQMDQQAAKQRGQGYQRSGAIQSSITTTEQYHNSLTLHVTIAATYAYQMNQDQQQTLAQLVAGKSTTQATTTLLQVPGVQTVAISTNTKNDVLPSDPHQIHVIWLQE